MIVNVIVSLDAYTTVPGLITEIGELERAGVASVQIEGPGDASSPSPGDSSTSPFEAVTLAGYLARKTSRIGIVPASSALYGFPYHLARRLATLDHLSGGRAGWAVRTRATERDATAYDWTSPGAAAEGERSAEFVHIARLLWDSWEPGAQRPDKASGEFKDDSRIHPIDYRTPAFLVRGPLDVPPSPQRRPMIYADVRDAADCAFAARFADAVNLAAPTPDGTARLYDRLMAALSDAGRDGQVRVLPVVTASPSGGVAAAAGAAATMASLGADGVTVRGAGRVGWASWFTAEYLPALGPIRATPPGSMLAEMLRIPVPTYNTETAA